MTTPLPFTAATVRRAIKGAQSAGLEITAVSVRPDGTVTVHHVAPPVAAQTEQDEDKARTWERFQA